MTARTKKKKFNVFAEAKFYCVSQDGLPNSGDLKVFLK